MTSPCPIPRRRSLLFVVALSGALAACDAGLTAPDPTVTDPIPFPEGPPGVSAAVVANWVTFTVDTPFDGVDIAPGDGVCQTLGEQCTLRAAIQEANALPDPAVIKLAAQTHRLTLPEPPGYGIEGGDLNIESNVVVEGPEGGLATITALDQFPVFRVGGVGETVWATFDRLVIREGSGRVERLPPPLWSLGAGGINILRDGNAIVWRSRIEDNQGIDAGGVGLTGTRYIQWDTTVRDNRSDDLGAGVTAYGGDLTIRRSVFHGNTCEASGPSTDPTPAAAIVDVLNPATITQSTVSGNDCTGVTVDGAPGYLNNVTITDNTGHGLWFNPAGSGSGVHNSIVSGNGLDDCYFPGPGFVVPASDVMLGTLPICPNLEGQPGVFYAATPGLDPLGDYGGPTWTHRLQPGSPAIDAGPLSPYADKGGKASRCYSRDQRGAPRLNGCDLGAYEVNPSFGN